MKFPPFLLVIAFAVSTPSPVASQTNQFTNCHTPESSGNFVGPDETLVNGMVCKVAKAAPPQQQVVAKQPAPLTTSSQSQPTSGQGADITNSRVVDMSKMGLDDDIIIAKMKHTTCHFQLGDSDLVELKKAGVSSKVIAAMLDAAASPAIVSVPGATQVVAEPTTAPDDGKIRVLVTDSQSWETRGSSAAGGNSNGWGGSSHFSGGARPQTAEIIKTLNERCPEFTVTNNLGKANFVVTLDHEGGKGLLAHRNKVAVFNHDGDVIFSASTRELGNAVKDACQADLPPLYAWSFCSKYFLMRTLNEFVIAFMCPCNRILV